MENAVEVGEGWLLSYWRDAVGPLHGLTWQTGSLLVMIVLATALIATWVLSISWIWPWTRKAVSAGVIKHTAHTYKDHLRLSAADYLRFHGLKPDASLATPAVAARRTRDLDRYYVVTIVEKDKRKVVVYRELKLQCPMGGRWRTEQGQIQLDETLLTQVRFENGNVEDDDPEAPINGRYDIYVRPVRWYDVRHWLLHPNREIRIVIWVTLITTTLPVLLDVLFG
jgi:hypothetical protein